MKSEFQGKILQQNQHLQSVLFPRTIAFDERVHKTCCQTLSFSFVHYVEFSGGLPLYTRFQTPVPRSP